MTERMRLGVMRPWGEQTCSFGLTYPECSERATHHVKWLEDGSSSATCQKHLTYIKIHNPPEHEVHTFGSDCCMPGTLWYPATVDAAGFCRFPDSNDHTFVAEEPTLRRENVKF